MEHSPFDLNQTIDLAVLGASPAGIHTATQAAHRNLSVVICSERATNESQIDVSSRLKSLFTGTAREKYEEYWSNEIEENELTVFRYGTIKNVVKTPDRYLIQFTHGHFIYCRAMVFASESYDLTKLLRIFPTNYLAFDGLYPVVDEHFESSLKNIFMIGECLGEHSSLSGMNQGLIAANAIGGKLSSLDQKEVIGLNESQRQSVRASSLRIGL